MAISSMRTRSSWSSGSSSVGPWIPGWMRTIRHSPPTWQGVLGAGQGLAPGPPPVLLVLCQVSHQANLLRRSQTAQDDGGASDLHLRRYNVPQAIQGAPDEAGRLAIDPILAGALAPLGVRVDVARALLGHHLP